MALDKSVNEKIFNVLQVIRRVLFSVGNSKENTPAFFCIVTADIKNGFEIKQIFYFLDLKKLSYSFISQTEYSIGLSKTQQFPQKSSATRRAAI